MGIVLSQPVQVASVLFQVQDIAVSREIQSHPKDSQDKKLPFPRLQDAELRCSFQKLKLRSSGFGSHGSGLQIPEDAIRMPGGLFRDTHTHR